VIISGVGFLNEHFPIVGRSTRNDPRVDAGFTFLSGINGRRPVSSLICGILGEVSAGLVLRAAGWHPAGGMFIAAINTCKACRATRSDRPGPRVSVRSRWSAIYLCAILALPLIWLLMQLGHACCICSYFPRRVAGLADLYICVRCTQNNDSRCHRVLHRRRHCFFSMYEQLWFLLLSPNTCCQGFLPSL